MCPHREVPEGRACMRVGVFLGGCDREGKAYGSTCMGLGLCLYLICLALRELCLFRKSANSSGI